MFSPIVLFPNLSRLEYPRCWVSRGPYRRVEFKTVRVIAAILFAGFSLGGRWIQLHPERIVTKGQFVGPDTRGARLFRAQMAILGTFVVFGGTTAAVFSLLSLVIPASVRFEVIAELIGGVAGVFAAIRVRKEARTRPQYVSTSPYGWWP